MKNAWLIFPVLNMLAALSTEAQFSSRTLDVPDARATYAEGISGGNVVGYYADAKGNDHGFFFDGTNYSTIDAPNANQGDGTGTFLFSISGGSVVGYYFDVTNAAHSFIYSGGKFAILNDPRAIHGTFATGISGSTVVGYYGDYQYESHGFIWTNGVFNTLDEPNAAYGETSSYEDFGTQITGISGSNIVGNYSDSDLNSHGFLYNGTNFITMDEPKGVGETMVQGVSGSNIVGYFADESFFYNGATYMTLYDDNGIETTVVQGVSGNTIVGYYTDANYFTHGFVTTISSNLDFTINITNNTAEVSGYLGAGGDGTIPATINGLPVTSISDFGLSYASLTNGTIPDSVTNIGNFAFNACGLSNVAIPAGVIHIGTAPFQSCESLTSITVNSGNLAYASLEGVLFNKSQTSLIDCPASLAGSAYIIPNGVTTIETEAFLGCFGLKSVTMNNGLLYIGTGAFQSCDHLTSVTIPDSVITMGDNVFELCTSLSQVTLGANLGNIGDSAFADCGIAAITIPAGVTNLGLEAFDNDKLYEITVDAGNSTYASVNGVVFNKSLTMVVQVPNYLNGSYTIPASVTTIGDMAFFDCGLLTNVTIPASVTNIEDNAFLECINLRGFYFEGNAPTAGTNVFDDGLTVSNLIATAYYLQGATGWGPNYAGIPTAVWIPQKGSVEVSINPIGAINAGAQWQLDGGASILSGSTLGNVPVGDHNVSFVSIPGWTTPLMQAVTIKNDATTKITGTYVKLPTGNPKLTVTAPKNKQSISNSPVLLIGTVKDNVAVSSVFYRLNGGAWTLANPSSSWNNWTVSVVPLLGLNTVEFYAVDSSATSSAVTMVSFNFVPGAELTVVTDGNGTISPNDNGRTLQVGANYTLSAASAKNWLFENWVASGGDNYVSNNPVLKFKMQSNLVLTATFVTNPFIAAQGGYHGLFAPPEIAREQTNSGSFVFNLLNTGAFSGKLYLGSSTVPLAGQFDTSGHMQTNLTVKGGKPLSLTLQLDYAGQSVSGTVSDGSFIAQVDGDLNLFAANHPATRFAGRYTWTIPGTSDPKAGPYGTSYGTVTVSTAGVVTFAGKLADGTTASQSSAVSKNGRWPMYLLSSNPNESVFGWNYFTNQTLQAPEVSWISGTNKSKEALYTQGFTNLQAAVTASFYIPTKKPLLELTAAQVILEGGDLRFSITNQISLAANNTITVPVSAENSDKLKLMIIPATGLITGSFQNPANAKQTITINGVLLQNQTNAAGYLSGSNQTGLFLLNTP